MERMIQAFIHIGIASINQCKIKQRKATCGGEAVNQKNTQTNCTGCGKQTTQLSTHCELRLDTHEANKIIRQIVLRFTGQTNTKSLELRQSSC